MAEFIYLNGNLIPRSKGRISPFDHGFLYGYGLFETMRAYNGHIFRLDCHLARLLCSIESLGLAHSVIASLSSVIASEAKQSLETACMETLKANKLKDARLRLTITAGEGEMTPDPGTCSNPTVLVTARELTPLPPEKYEQGFKTVLSPLRRDSHSPLSRLKSTCYLNSILAKMEVKANGYDEAILLNEQGQLAEGSTSNIFLLIQGILITPSLESGVLPGITREAVIEIARALDIKVEERKVELKELTKAEEAFLTNSIMEIMPLTWFADEPIGTGKAALLTMSLMSAYKELVNKTLNKIA